MLHKSFLNIMLSVFACVLVSGCVSDSRQVSFYEGVQAGLDFEGLRDVLEDQPGVESVEEWDNKYGSGAVIRTAHYKIYTTLDEPLMLRGVPAYMESCYRAYQGKFGLDVVSAELMDVYLFKSREQWEKFTVDTTGELSGLYLKIQRGAYYTDGRCVAYNIGRKKTFSVMGHEGWHQFSHRNFMYRLPSWLDEGIAMQFEAFDERDGYYHFDSQKNLGRLAGLKKQFQTGKFISLDELVVLNPGIVISMEDDGATSAYYSQVWALVRFLTEYQYGSYKSGLVNMVNGAMLGTWPVDSKSGDVLSDKKRVMSSGMNSYISAAMFNEYIDGDVSILEAEYAGFCLKESKKIRFKYAN